MVHQRSGLIFLVLIALLLASCNMPESGSIALGAPEHEELETHPGSTVIPEPPPVPLRPPAFNINGVWQGSMLDRSSMITQAVTLEIHQESGSTTFTGTILFTHPDDVNASEAFTIIGYLAGDTMHFHDNGAELITHYFWGHIAGDTITAWVSLSGYSDADAYGEITLSR